MVEHQPLVKYLFLIGDGMADYPVDELGGITPLIAAKTPHMDRIAACRRGTVRTIPHGMDPGSDVANLSLLGYDPGKYHSGRAPLEAASMGVILQPNQVAFRLNLVTLEWTSDLQILMRSHNSGDITMEEAYAIVETLRQEMKQDGVEIFPGVAYRHLLVWDKASEEETIPPHDVLDQDMAPYLNDRGKKIIPGMIRRSWKILRDHPVNKKRKEQGLKEANSIWLWGQGHAIKLPSFGEQYGLKGGIISAVDLVRGIGVLAGLEPIPVPGATGYLNTNYQGKAHQAVSALDRMDFVFVHVEAPDEAGHHGDPKEKIEAIEAFDEKVVGTALSGLSAFPDYRIMVASDHFTPVSKRTHTKEPAPFAWARKQELEKIPPQGPGFSEEATRSSGLVFEKGHELIESFLSPD